MILTNLLFLIVGSQVKVNADVQYAGKWKTTPSISPTGKEWLGIKQKSDKTIEFLRTDNSENRIRKVDKLFPTANGDYTVENAYICGKILVAFKSELKEHRLAPRLIYILNESSGSSEAEFLRVGYTALNQYKQGTEWHSAMGDELLRLFPNDLELIHAYIYETIYSTTSEARVNRSIERMPILKTKWTKKNYFGALAMLLEKNYWETKKENYRNRAISAWEEYIKSSTEDKAKKSAQGRIKSLKSG